MTLLEIYDELLGKEGPVGHPYPIALVAFDHWHRMLAQDIEPGCYYPAADHTSSSYFMFAGYEFHCMPPGTTGFIVGEKQCALQYLDALRIGNRIIGGIVQESWAKAINGLTEPVKGTTPNNTYLSGAAYAPPMKHDPLSKEEALKELRLAEQEERYEDCITLKAIIDKP